MTRVYKPIFLEGYEWVTPVDDNHLSLFRCDGRSWSEGWSPIDMEYIHDDEGVPCDAYSDFPWRNETALVLRERAYEALYAWLAPYGEFLEVRCGGDTLFVFNCTHFVAALNHEESELKRLHTGTVVRIKKYSFASGVSLPCAFRVSENPSAVLFTDEFVHAAVEAGLTGIEFYAVWDSETGSFGHVYYARRGGSLAEDVVLSS